MLHKCYLLQYEINDSIDIDIQCWITTIHLRNNNRYKNDAYKEKEIMNLREIYLKNTKMFGY